MTQTVPCCYCGRSFLEPDIGTHLQLCPLRQRAWKVGPLQAMAWKGGWWIRLFGKGIAWQDENVHDWRRFSVRVGHVPALFVQTNRGLRWRFEWLR